MNMQTEMKLPAKLRPLREIVEEYETKKAAAVDVAAAFGDAIKATELAANIGGTYGGQIWDRYAPRIGDAKIVEVLRKSAWLHVYNGLNIKTIAPAADRKRFDLAMENPPEFTLDNIAATFGQYLKDPRHHILRGLAEAFCKLDPAYKSHSKVKIGVEGLPKRVILSGFGEYGYGSWGQETMLDMLNALANYTKTEQLHRGHIDQMARDARKNGSAMWWGGELRVFKNGNAHVIFDKWALKEINRALAEFYGDVLPDVEVSDEDRPKAQSTAVSKDLQFYWTPPAVANSLIREIHWGRYDETAPMDILEPSCGNGRIMEAIAAHIRKESHSIRRPVQMAGIEYNAERAAQARAKGFSVLCRNFLECAPDPRFDLVIMNPPFYGLHWQKHLTHARKFLKASPTDRRGMGGQLICVLPATAFYDGHLGKMGLVRADAHTAERGHLDSGWHDLPVASFSESGTNVPTGYIVLHA
ncbi:N6 adenine-specific DNA methyltransferase N12 class [Primorskyibacter flagellatus]|uniref:N6 adenine-specific DNA methyltransferase N12 class n=1 Tax=Primorskyibacter flagellatus TaxID=1387277 RepID=A0A917A5Z0_9RHOB|nr:DUF4942 domain-containing protein [Primorskyibacter flagellatus]GGE30026.1 N6 adenine-specific DNA methyltransferase N12 class [Primorskyibacter flagellatus]